MLRLTGGEFRGRMIQTPPEKSGKVLLRPTQARLRQALFNSLQAQVGDAKVLDLFGGSGALGFEALSRGASHVTFIENAPAALKLIEKNALTLCVEDRVRIIRDSVSHTAKLTRGLAPFDLVLADPPYEEGWEEKLLRDFNWSELLTVDGLFCLEWGVQKSQLSELPERVPFLLKAREKNYGDSVLTTYQRVEEA